MDVRTISTGRKVALSFAAVGAAAAVAGLGTFGTFTSTTSASEDVSTGTVTIGLDGSGTGNRLSVDVTNVVPGDTAQRVVNLNNTGSEALASIKLTTSATTSSLLDTDATNGLQMTITECPDAWTEAGTSPQLTYTCSGTVRTVVASRRVIGTDLTLDAPEALASGATSHLLVTLSLPQAADNTFQDQDSTIAFSFNGTQRAGTNR